MHNTTHGGCPGADLWQGTSGSVGGPANDTSLYPEYSTFTFTRRHVETIMAHDTTQPLFIYAPFQNAHVPLQVTPTPL